MILRLKKNMKSKMFIQKIYTMQKKAFMIGLRIKEILQRNYLKQ
jgi:hypothetical protein